MMMDDAFNSEAGFGAGVQKRVLKATAEGLAEATGTAALTLQTRLMREVLDALWIPYGLPEDEQSVQLDAAYALMREIAPRDALEGLLTAQMAGIHGAAMDCLRRAMQPGQTDEVRDSALGMAARLLTLYPRQMEALDRRRGRGSHHTLTVRHVTVEAAEPAEPAEAVGEDVMDDTVHEAVPADGDAAPVAEKEAGMVRDRAGHGAARASGENRTAPAQGDGARAGREAPGPEPVLSECAREAVYDPALMPRPRRAVAA